MASFACKTRDAAGSLVETTVSADSKREALRQLEESGLFPVEICEIGGVADAAPADLARQARPGREKQARTLPDDRPPGDGRVKRKELMRFSMQLASSIGAGVPILTGIKSIHSQTTSQSFRSVLRGLMNDIESGLSLSGAMLHYPKAFPAVYAHTIAAGEKSGCVEPMLYNLAEFLEAEMEMRADVRSALLYPAIVIGALSLAVTVLIVFVVPRFAAFYSGFDSELPVPTRVLISSSTFMKENLLFVAVGAAASIFGLKRLIRTDAGKRFVDRSLLRIPVVGHLIETALTLNVVQLLGLSTQAGLPVVEALESITRTTSNSKYRQELVQVTQGVISGGSLTDSMEEAGCLPVAARQMLANGEMTGSLERSCFAVAKHYKKELGYQTKTLATFVEPVLTLVLGMIVLFIALAVFLPMWDLVKVVGK